MDTIIHNNILKIYPTMDEVLVNSAQFFYEQAQKNINIKNEFTVVLSGGSTAQIFFEILVSSKFKNKVNWEKIKFFFADERYVNKDDLENNYHNALVHLFSKVPVKPENVFRIPTEFPDPKESAKIYAHHLHSIKFDLVILGLGENAHTASLMPQSDILEKKDPDLAESLWVPELSMFRITMMPAAINQSHKICFIVFGAKKALAVWQTLLGPHNPIDYPAQLIHSHDPIIWFLDEEAAEKVSKKD